MTSDLMQLSFLEMQALEQEIGVKEFDKRILGQIEYQSKNDSQNEPAKVKTNHLKKKSFAKDSKRWDPVEISSKIKPNSKQLKAGTRDIRIRDPRFDNTSGTFDKDLFAKGYAFLDDMKASEERDLKKFIKTSKDENKVFEAKQKLQKMKIFSRKKKEEKVEEKKLKEWKKAEADAVLSGKKRPFFLKKSEQKKLNLAEKFKELKKTGQLDKYMEKKRKRNAAKLKKRTEGK